MKLQQRTLNLLLVSITVIATGAAVFFGMKKGNAANPIMLPAKKGAGKSTSSTDLAASFYYSYTSLIVENQGRRLDANTILQDNSLRKIALPEFAGGNTKLVFRYSNSDCDMCVDFVLKKLKNEFKDSVDHYVRVVTDSYSERDYRLKISSMQSEIPIWNIPGGKLGLTLEKKNLPFLFVLSGDYSVGQLFIPFKELPEVTDSYLSYIHQQITRPLK